MGLLGLIQGLTEFLPISSSGHLALFRHVLNIEIEKPIVFDSLLHIGTVLSIFVFFYKEIFLRLKSYILPIVFGSIPTAILGLALEGIAQDVSKSPFKLSLAFLLTALLLLLTLYKKGEGMEGASLGNMSLLKAFVIGIVQGISVIPGISRSGSTISAGILLGVHPYSSFEFSFLLSIPAVLGANVLEILKNPSCFSEFSNFMLFGIFTAFLSGLFALFILSKVVRRLKLWIFSPYLFILSLILWLY